MKVKRRTKMRNYVRIPKGLIEKLGRDKALVWAEIFNYANMGLGKCVQSMDAMRKELGMDKDYFRGLVDELVADGYFYRQRRIGTTSEFIPTSKGIDEANQWQPPKKPEFQTPPQDRGSQQEFVNTNPTGEAVPPYRSKRQQKEYLKGIPISSNSEDSEEEESLPLSPDVAAANSTGRAKAEIERRKRIRKIDPRLNP